jgi:ubiquinone/menaquinone biosynthesis C-methylase UbiE
MNLDACTAEEFTIYMKRYLKLYREIASIIKDSLTSTTPVILDLGCGPGLLLQAIGTLLPTAKVMGIDVSLEMLRLAHQQGEQARTRGSLMQGTAEHIPLQDSSVDVVVSRFSLPYWNKPELGFAEISRILKPEGMLILEALNKDFPRWKLRLIQLHMHLNKATQKVIAYHIDAYDIAYSRKEIEAFLSGAELTLKRIRGSKHTWKYRMVAEKK